MANLSPAEIKEENQKRRLLAKKFKSSSARIRLVRDPNAPKRPRTAYIRFFQEQYGPDVTTGRTIQENAKEAGARWKTMSDAEKRVLSLSLSISASC